MSEEHILDWPAAVRFREENAHRLEGTATLEACIGTEGRSETAFGPREIGRVHVHHRVWEAENDGDDAIGPDEPIQVLGYRGDYLVVQKKISDNGR